MKLPEGEKQMIFSSKLTTFITVLGVTAVDVSRFVKAIRFPGPDINILLY